MAAPEPPPPPEGPASLPLSPKQVLSTAGSLDNPFRTLQTLPGVVGTDEFGSKLSVRGGAPDQNLKLMDGVEIHNPYRLFGLTSAFNPETVGRFELLAGGFGARYGDRLSSVLCREPDDASRPQRVVAASITDANVSAKAAARSGKGSWLATARRTTTISPRTPPNDSPFNDDQDRVAASRQARLLLGRAAARSPASR